MRVDVREVSSVMREVDVEVPSEVVGRELDRAYRDLARRARVPGFRPGKVPRNILEKRYGSEINRQVSGQLVTDTLGEALRSASLSPVGAPAVQKENLTPGQAYRYKLRLEVKPIFEPTGYFELEGELKKAVVADEEVEHEVERLREQRAVLRPVEGREEVAAGDWVVLDYQATVDGKPFEGGAGQDRTVHVGSGGALPGFEEALVGALVGRAHTFSVQLPPDLQNKKIAGRQATFTATVKEVKEKHVPALDDELAKELTQVDTVAELKAKIREQLEERARNRAERELRDQLLDAALERNSFDVPHALVESELEQSIRETRLNLTMMGIDPEQVPLDERRMREEMLPRAEKRARQRLLLEAVAERESVEAEEAELEARIRAYAESSGQALAKVRQTFTRPERRERLRAQIREEKVLDLLRSRARIKDAVSEETEEKSGSTGESPVPE